MCLCDFTQKTPGNSSGFSMISPHVPLPLTIFNPYHFALINHGLEYNSLSQSCPSSSKSLKVRVVLGTPNTPLLRGLRISSSGPLFTLLNFNNLCLCCSSSPRASAALCCYLPPCYHITIVSVPF